ncbi:MAG TPA: hypothetical protein VEA69_19385 [Tepidisphaeraceae bacterium]|nr:hypothetical protein [Tepidisphaeraceae bacterium]
MLYRPSPKKLLRVHPVRDPHGLPRLLREYSAAAPGAVRVLEVDGNAVARVRAGEYVDAAGTAYVTDAPDAP